MNLTRMTSMIICVLGFTTAAGHRVGAALAMQRFVALAADIATISWVVSP